MGAVTKGPTWRDFPRPSAPYYETRSRFLSEGDIFEDVPYTVVGAGMPMLADATSTAHAILPVFSVPAMLLTPTCDFRRPSIKELEADSRLEPYTLETRVRVGQVLSIDEIERTFTAANRAQNLDKIRKFDALRRYMYLPPLEGRLGESVVSLGPTWLVDIHLLLSLDRVTQLTFSAARQLHYKTVMYATGTIVAPNSFSPSMD